MSQPLSEKKQWLAANPAASTMNCFIKKWSRLVYADFNVVYKLGVILLLWIIKSLVQAMHANTNLQWVQNVMYNNFFSQIIVTLNSLSVFLALTAVALGGIYMIVKKFKYQHQVCLFVCMFCLMIGPLLLETTLVVVVVVVWLVLRTNKLLFCEVVYFCLYYYYKNFLTI